MSFTAEAQLLQDYTTIIFFINHFYTNHSLSKCNKWQTGADEHHSFLRTNSQKTSWKAKNCKARAGIEPMSTRAIGTVVLVTRRRECILGQDKNYEVLGFEVTIPPNLIQVSLMVEENKRAKKRKEGCMDGHNGLIMRFSVCICENS